MQFYISLDSYSPKRALREGPSNPLTVLVPPRFVLSDNFGVEVFLMNDAGVIQSASAENSLILGIGEPLRSDPERLMAYVTLTASLSSYTGLLDLGTDELRDRINSGSSANLTFEIQMTAGGERRTILQTDTVVYADLLNDTEGYNPTAFPPVVTVPVLEAGLAGKVDLSRYEIDSASFAGGSFDSSSLDNRITNLEETASALVSGTVSLSRYETDSGSFSDRLDNVAIDTSSIDSRIESVEDRTALLEVSASSVNTLLNAKLNVSNPTATGMLRVPSATVGTVVVGNLYVTGSQAVFNEGLNSNDSANFNAGTYFNGNAYFNGDVEIYSDLALSNVTADEIEVDGDLSVGNEVSAYVVSASFLNGDGSGITNLSFENITGVPVIVSSSAQIDFNNIQNKPTASAVHYGDIVEH